MNNIIRPAVGRYSIIRSSEDENAMIRWNTPEFDNSCGRWFESCGCGFASWRDAKYLQETDDLEMEVFRENHPDICVKESFCELEYGKDPEIIESAWIFLAEYDGRREGDLFCPRIRTDSRGSLGYFGATCFGGYEDPDKT